MSGFALDVAGVGVDSGKAGIAVVVAVPALVDVVGFEYFLTPAGIDGKVEIEHKVTTETELVVDAVEVGREGVRNKDVGFAADDFGTAERDTASPRAIETVGDGDAVDGYSVGWSGDRVGSVRVVERVGVGPLVGGAGDFGDVELYAFGEEEYGVVGPDTHVTEVGVANDFGGGLIGTAGGVGEVDGVGTFAEAVKKGVTYV